MLFKPKQTDSYESPPQSDPDDVDEMHEKLTKQVRIQQTTMGLEDETETMNLNCVLWVSEEGEGDTTQQAVYLGAGGWPRHARHSILRLS